MEPLDVASTDWIKDYDPLFDLFDEEMQMGDAESAAVASHAWPSALSAACGATYYTPISDYYYTAASFAASAAPASTQQYHVAPVAPTQETAPPAGSAAYPPANQAAEEYDLSHYYNQQYQQHASISKQDQQHHHHPREQQEQLHNNNQHQNDHNQREELPLLQPPDELSLFLGLDWLPCLENELPEAPIDNSASTSSSPAPSTPAISQIQSETTSSSSSSAYSSAAPSPTAVPSPCDSGASVATKTSSASKKRKQNKSRGTSLLAQPSPKAASNKVNDSGVKESKIKIKDPVTSYSKTTSMPVHIITSASPALAPSRTSTTKNVPILKLSRTATLQQPLNVSTITTTTATLVTYSNLANIMRQTPLTTIASPITNIAAPSMLTTIATNSVDEVVRKARIRQLTKPELYSQLCASVEHDYARAPC